MNSKRPTGMSDDTGGDRDERPGGSDGGALRAPWQIRTAGLGRLREDERLWAAYERGCCDFFRAYLDSKLMQGETDYVTLYADRDVPTAAGPRARADDETTGERASDGRTGDRVSDECRPTGTARPSSESAADGAASDADDDGDGIECYDASGSDCGSDASRADQCASGDSSRDADAEVRRVMSGDGSPDSSEADAVRSFPADRASAEPRG